VKLLTIKREKKQHHDFSGLNSFLDSGVTYGTKRKNKHKVLAIVVVYMYMTVPCNTQPLYTYFSRHYNTMQ